MKIHLFYLLFLVACLISPSWLWGQTLKVYTRPGCQHCENTKSYLLQFHQKYPDIKIEIFNIWSDKLRMQELQDYARSKKIENIGVPLLIGPKGYHLGAIDSTEQDEILLEILGLKKLAFNRVSKFRLPILGEISSKTYGPLSLTLLLGLIDGFNPCAMWVLLILLSLLVHLKDRKKIFLISGVFVVVSGVVYFLFMNSWLLFYDFIGFSRKLQLVIAMVALMVGLTHVKDFFWLARGISFSIPEKMKFKIAQKAGTIVRSHSLWISLFSAATLAIFVNFVELLCTAGIPAVYTQIMAQNGIIGFERVLYLVIYTIAYMIDDALMVLVATWTMRQSRLQEKTGEWLKLVSGSILLILSVMMIFFPEYLRFEF